MIDRNDGAVLVSEYFDLGWVTEFRYINTEIFEDIKRILTMAWLVKKVFPAKTKYFINISSSDSCDADIRNWLQRPSAKRMY